MPKVNNQNEKITSIYIQKDKVKDLEFLEKIIKQKNLIPNQRKNAGTSAYINFAIQFTAQELSQKYNPEQIDNDYTKLTREPNDSEKINFIYESLKSKEKIEKTKQYMNTLKEMTAQILTLSEIETKNLIEKDFIVRNNKRYSANLLIKTALNMLKEKLSN